MYAEDENKDLPEVSNVRDFSAEEVTDLCDLKRVDSWAEADDLVYALARAELARLRRPE